MKIVKINKKPFFLRKLNYFLTYIIQDNNSTFSSHTIRRINVKMLFFLLSTRTSIVYAEHDKLTSSTKAKNSHNAKKLLGRPRARAKEL